jgi:phosphoribosylformylglycinamidine cyclo-ligase
VLPPGLGAVVDRATWAPQPVFGLVAEVGAVPEPELERTLNMGVGMVAVLPAADVDPALELLAGRGVPAWVAGEVRSGEGQVTLVGAHRAG